jgi:tetratricopeptide (TPR) repeat protein
MLAGGCTLLPDTEGRKEFKEAVDLYNKGDCKNASLKFTRALQKDADLLEGYVYMAACSLKQGDPDAALKSAQQAMAAAARDADMSSRLKTILVAGGQKALENKEDELAVRFFREAVTLVQKDSGLRLLLGTALLGRGNKEDMKAAITEFKAAISTSASPGQTMELIRSALFARAEQYAAQGDTYTQSRCYLAYTENFNKDDVEACIHIGKLFFQTDNPVGALHYAKKAYALDPQNKAAMELIYELNAPMQH